MGPNFYEAGRYLIDNEPCLRKLLKRTPIIWAFAPMGKGRLQANRGQPRTDGWTLAPEMMRRTSI